MDPLTSTISPVLLFPDRHRLFESINQPLTRGKGIFAMRCTDRQDDTRFTQFQMANPVHNDTFLNWPALPDLSFQFRQFDLCHLRVTLVVERRGTTPSSQFPGGSHKQHNCTCARRTRRAQNFAAVDHIIRQGDHRTGSNRGKKLPGAIVPAASRARKRRRRGRPQHANGS